ncbi:MAG: 30S ribosomal protein S18 [Candidatus Marinarcus sp.]|uniref:30S ribosomal protein S18 n=1 Tax=Candidatus Marinarcus sp. TaxID=3100987 RepID=UPI003B002B22
MAERRKYGKKFCKYTEMKVDFIDYKHVDILKLSMSERGKIMPRRLTGNSKRSQEMVETAIKRARHMALVPYIVNTKNVTDAAFVR